MRATSTAEGVSLPAGPTNWAGNLSYSTATFMTADSIDEIIDLVKKHDRLKVLGTRHCFNNIADSRDRFLSLGPLDKIGPLNERENTVTVAGGVRYGDLAAWLDARGFALHNLASLPHISIAGGCATATHGSGLGNGNLSSAVRSISLVLASGESLTLSRDKDKELFPGVVVNLGALGVITSLTLDIQPAFRMRQYVYENLSFRQLEHHFEEIMTAGYSVSLFTSWRNENIEEVWIKSSFLRDHRDGFDRHASFDAGGQLRSRSRLLWRHGGNDRSSSYSRRTGRELHTPNGSRRALARATAPFPDELHAQQRERAPNRIFRSTRKII